MPRWLPKKQKYHPGGIVSSGGMDDGLWSPEPDDLYSLTVTYAEMAQSIEDALEKPVRRVSERCHGCHSSEFDSRGKCVYCRQYPRAVGSKNN